MCRISAAKGAYWLYILLKRVVAPWKYEGGYEFLVLKMILNSADRDASASFSLAASQNGSLLYIPTSWSLASRKWFHSLSRLSSVHAERSRIIPVLFVSSPFFHWLKVRVVGFFHVPCCTSPRACFFFLFFSNDWTQNHISSASVTQL